jgi:hypothetical protein
MPLFCVGRDGCGFVVLHVKYCVELRDLEQVMDLLGQVQQLELAAFFANGGESADQFSNAGAVNVGDVAKVEKDLLFALAEDLANDVAQNHAAFAESDATA